MQTLSENNRRLDGWKEIASYLGKSIRTVQRWERTLGLPVRRIKTEKSESIYAHTADLDEWLRTRSSDTQAELARDDESDAPDVPAVPVVGAVSQGPPGWIRWAFESRLGKITVVTVTLLLIVAAILTATSLLRGGNPASYRLTPDSLVVFDERGRELWEHRFDQRLFLDAYADHSRERVWIGPLHESSEKDVLFAFSPERNRKEALICFGPNGKERWRYLPGGEVRTATEKFSDTYGIIDILVLKTGQGLRIAVSSLQSPYYPTQLTLLDADGNVTGEYWHSGHLNHLYSGDVNHNGREQIYALGIDNEYKTATMVVLDPLTIRGRMTSSQTDARYQLLDMPLATESARLWFPRSCINRATQSYNIATQLIIHPDGASVIVCEDWGKSGCDKDSLAEKLYDLTRELTPKAVDTTPHYEPRHRELEKAGLLDHPFTATELKVPSNLDRPAPPVGAIPINPQARTNN